MGFFLATWLIVAITIVATIVSLIVIGLLTPKSRATLVRIYYLFSNLLGVDLGIKGLVQLLLVSALPAAAVALNKGLSDRNFGWLVLEIFLIIAIANIVVNILNSSLLMKDYLSPSSGKIWREDRKIATAGIIKRVTLNIEKGGTSLEEVHTLLKDVLDVIVSHVKDHRGSHSKDRYDVFANILLEDGDKLVVVARDSIQHNQTYERKIPAWYKRSSLLCGRALDCQKPLSVGDLVVAYPEGPRNKPYRSILAVPLLGTDDKGYGCLSIDSSRPYFFESFATDQLEDGLEKGLQPYIQLITMTLERLVSKDKREVVKHLAQSVLPEPLERDSNDTTNSVTSN